MHNILRSPLFEEAYRPTFSGHETFPLRYGWLKKAYDVVADHTGKSSSRDLFTDDEAIARFGVGKNMVTSMRHWATCCGVLLDAGKAGLRTAPLGDLIFAADGVDPFLEHPATLWLLHWQLASYDPEGTRPNKTTWHWVINHYPGLAFEKDDLVEGLTKLAATRNWSLRAATTIKSDVDCFVRTYESRQAERESVEDALSSPLSELGLVSGYRNRFQLVRGAKRSLPNGVFIYALAQFWQRYGPNRSLSFEALAHEPGAPGRVFLLDEADLADRLLGLEDASKGAFKWSETAGLKQLLRQRDMTDAEIKRLLRASYKSHIIKEAA